MIHQDLLKVPRDVITLDWCPKDLGSSLTNNSTREGTARLYERVNGIFLSTVDLYFLEEWKIRLKSTTRSYVLQTIHNFSSIGPRFLVMELIARKRQDSEATFVLSI